MAFDATNRRKKWKKNTTKKWKYGKEKWIDELVLDLNTNHWSDTIQWQTQQIFGKMFTNRVWDGFECLCVWNNDVFLWSIAFNLIPTQNFSVNCRYLENEEKKTTRHNNKHNRQTSRRQKNPYRIHKKCELISHKCVSWHSLIYQSHSMNLGAPFFSYLRSFNACFLFIRRACFPVLSLFFVLIAVIVK